MDVDLEDARDALDAVRSSAMSDRRILARHADLWTQHLSRRLSDGAALAFAALTGNGRTLVGHLSEAAWRCRSMADAAAEQPSPQEVFIGFCDSISGWFPAASLADATRREELIRRFAAFNRFGLSVGGKPEAAARSERVLQRLDVRTVTAEEARLTRERKLAAALEDVRNKIRSGSAL